MQAITQDTRVANTLKLVSEFNRPYKTAVAINCANIGDDNDYSCFLSNCTFELWAAGKKDIALQLANTDPLLTIQFNSDEFETLMQSRVKFNAEQKEAENLYYKLYRD